jgi:hypothetical protein
MALLGRTQGARLVDGLARGLSLMLLAVLVLVSPVEMNAAPQAPEIREYQIKAVFLYNFAEFVDWPPGSFPSGQAPLVIGILGEDPFGTYLDEAVKGESINGRQIVIQRFGNLEDASACQILFISKSQYEQLDPILYRLSGRSILTVSDIADFAHRGGMIGFVVENSKVRLRINVRAVKEAHLTISSKLLRPAQIVSMRGR